MAKKVIRVKKKEVVDETAYFKRIDELIAGGMDAQDALKEAKEK